MARPACITRVEWIWLYYSWISELPYWLWGTGLGDLRLRARLRIWKAYRP